MNLLDIFGRIFKQESSPRGWLLAQNIIGGTPDKRRMLLQCFNNHSRIVEVGCSVGNIARALVGIPNISYVGLDIDQAAIKFAKQWFAPFPNFHFSTETLQDMASVDRKFDLICITGVLHHVDDDTAIKILRGANNVAAESATLLVFDPVPLKAGDSLTYRFIHKLEQGEHLREPNKLIDMIESSGFAIGRCDKVAIGPGIVPIPKIMDMLYIEAAKRDS